MGVGLRWVKGIAYFLRKHYMAILEKKKHYMAGLASRLTSPNKNQNCSK